MGIFDKVKDLAAQHGDKLDGAIDKATDAIDDKTGGRFSEKLDKGAEAAKGLVESAGGDDEEPPGRLSP